MDLMNVIKKEVVENVLYNKDIFLENGIILEAFDFEFGQYEKLLKEPFFQLEASAFYIRIPLKRSSDVFEFAVFFSFIFEPNIRYQIYRNMFNSQKPSVSVEVPFSEPFIEENFKGNYWAFSDYVRPILEKYFPKDEIDMFLSVVGSVDINIEPFIKYTEIII